MMYHVCPLKSHFDFRASKRFFTGYSPESISQDTTSIATGVKNMTLQRIPQESLNLIRESKRTSLFLR